MVDFNDMMMPPAEGEPTEGVPPVEGAEGMDAEADPLAEMNEKLAEYQPKDILQYLIDNNLIAPETTLLAPEGEAEAGAEAPMDFGAMM